MPNFEHSKRATCHKVTQCVDANVLVSVHSRVAALEKLTILLTQYFLVIIMAFVFTDENLRQEIEKGQPLVVDFWAEWCGPCKSIAPIVEQLAQEYEGRVLIGKYDVDEGTTSPPCCSSRVASWSTAMLAASRVMPWQRKSTPFSDDPVVEDTSNLQTIKFLR